MPDEPSELGAGFPLRHPPKPDHRDPYPTWPRSFRLSETDWRKLEEIAKHLYTVHVSGTITDALRYAVRTTADRVAKSGGIDPTDPHRQPPAE